MPPRTTISEYPELDENEAATMCFTSGTTGKPKGVVYSHRALVLHSLAECIDDTFGISHNDVILACSSMFHANAWGAAVHRRDDGSEADSARAACRRRRRCWT